MRNWRLLVSSSLAIAIHFSSFGAQDPQVTMWASEVSESRWRLRELDSKLSSNTDRQPYESQHLAWKEKSSQLAEKLVEQNKWKSFSSFYKELDEVGKQNFHFVVQGVLARLSDQHEPEKVQTFLQAQEYFPGYGFAKPGYIYRRGEEVKREFLYAYWKDEAIDEKTSESREMTLEVKLVEKIKIAIPELIEGVKFDLEIDGQIHKVVKVKFNKEVTIRTKQKRKVGVEKAWFKLFEAKKKWWGEPTWKLVGKTFQHDSSPTGESVIVEAEVIADPS